MRNALIFIFLVVITNPYSGRGIDYGEDEPQLYEYQENYSIKTYGPEEGKNETSFTEEETKRFIKKLDAIINTDYSPFVFED